VAAGTAVLLVEVYRVFFAEPDDPAAPAARRSGGRVCAVGDKRCVAALARKWATTLASTGRTDDSTKILGAAAALDRGDCEAALKAGQDVKAHAADPMADDLAFTQELVSVCVLDDYAADSSTGERK
jgi:hypothetical protein